MQGLAYCASMFAQLHRQLNDNEDLQLLLDEPLQPSKAELCSSFQARYAEVLHWHATQVFMPGLTVNSVQKISHSCNDQPSQSLSRCSLHVIQIPMHV